MNFGPWRLLWRGRELKAPLSNRAESPAGLQPGTELLLQQLNSKRKWLQIHFAAGVILCLCFSQKRLAGRGLGEHRRGALIPVSCSDLVRNQH